MDSLSLFVYVASVRQQLGVFFGRSIPTSFMSPDNVIEAEFVSRSSSSANVHGEFYPAPSDHHSTPPRGFKAIYKFVTSAYLT